MTLLNSDQREEITAYLTHARTLAMHVEDETLYDELLMAVEDAGRAEEMEEASKCERCDGLTGRIANLLERATNIADDAERHAVVEKRMGLTIGRLRAGWDVEIDRVHELQAGIRTMLDDSYPFREDDGHVVMLSNAAHLIRLRTLVNGGT